MYAPGIEGSIADLQAARTSFYTLAEDTLQLYIGYCESGLEQVKLDKKQLLNGSVKSELTNWWLKLIATRIELYGETPLSAQMHTMQCGLSQSYRRTLTRTPAHLYTDLYSNGATT